MRNFNEFRRLLWTLRYLSAGQISNRAGRTIRRAGRRVFKLHAPMPQGAKFRLQRELLGGLTDVAAVPSLNRDIQSAVDTAEKLARLNFSFLNKEVQFKEDPGWHDPQLSQLWRYHLHYFGYVQDLLLASSAGHSERSFQTFQRLAMSWIHQNQRLSGDGWHPYTISLRIVNWLSAAFGFRSQMAGTEVFRQQFLSSLYGQAQILSNSLEFDVRGNHLVENLRALIWAGIALDTPHAGQWRATGLRLLQKEVQEQVLPDGCHFERSPGYHLVVLKDLLELAVLLKRHEGGAPPWLDDAVRRMLNFAVTLLPRSCEIPLFKDTAWDAAPTPATIFETGAIHFGDGKFKFKRECGLYPQLLFGAAGKERFSELPMNETDRSSAYLGRSGYAVQRDDAKGDHLVFDVGAVCPDYLPAHAHADMLGFELVMAGERVIVDSGIYQYAAGPWRDFFRSTSAHNTIEVDQQNQSDVWSSFRVGRRARPRQVEWLETAESVCVRAGHDGFRRLPASVWHHRTLYWQKRCFWLVWDDLRGREKFAASSHVHFHPNFRLEAVDWTTWRIQGEEKSFWISAIGHQESTIISGQMVPRPQGWYSERFGERVPNTVLTLKSGGLKSCAMGYVVSQGEPVRIEINGQSTAGVLLHLSRNDFSWKIFVNSPPPDFAT